MFKKLILAAFATASLGGATVVFAKSAAAAEEVTFEYGALASSQGKAASPDKLGGVKPFVELAETFLQLDGVDGESDDDMHKNEIDLEYFLL